MRNLIDLYRTFHPCALLTIFVILFSSCSDPATPQNEKKTKHGEDTLQGEATDGTDSVPDGTPTDSEREDPSGSDSVPDDSGSERPVDTATSTSDSDRPTDPSDPDTGSEQPEDTATKDSDTGPKIDIPEGAAGFLHVEGNKLVDDNGNEARLTGINWFGFETSNQSPHGLWARDYRSMLRQIADLGFNTVRIPWSNAILKEGAAANSINTYGTDPYDGTDPLNRELDGKTPLEMLDLVIAAAAEFRLKVMLDNHSRAPDGYMEEHLWYTDETSEAQWIADWVFLAERYNGNTTVVALDLNNEPHGEASWGAGDQATDWNTAAEKCGNAILQVNPNVLIVVEGVEHVGDDTYWWGGNLKGVRTHPIALVIPEKLVYSAHEYGPEVFQQDWFTEGNFPDNMDAVWRDHFGFVMSENLGHVFIGEFGIKDPAAYEGRAGVWFDTFMEHLKNGYSWTFWCFNPNSGDTEGLLQYDWLTPNQWKMDALSPYLAPFID